MANDGSARPVKVRLRQRYRPLGGPDLERYTDVASRLILRARLNKWYPDPFGCSDRMKFLAPSIRKGVYDEVMVDRISGLPRLKDVLSVQMDRELAKDFIRQQDERLAAGRKLTPKVQAKLEYYRRLARIHLPPMTHLDVQLRRVYPERRTASFQVIFDRMDIAEGVFVRYTMLLEQTDKIWGSTLLERSGDYTRQTNDFRELIQKCAQDESEIMFLLLGKLEGVRLEEIIRGRVGPLWNPWTPAPAGWFPKDAANAFILHCPLDSASINREEDLDQDPFSEFFKDFLSKESRPLVEEAAQRLGYRVHKERKFACTREAAQNLRAKLKQAGTRNVVYTL